MSSAIEIELSDNGNILYIFFGGIRDGIAMPKFEFYSASKILDEHKIFIRDMAQAWYQDGLQSLTTNIQETANHIQSLIDEIQPEQVFFVGNSMGGFAAILFSALLGTGRVIAFAPQTFISLGLKIKLKDYRWRQQILSTYLRNIFNNTIYDLLPVLEQARQPLDISVFVADSDDLDVIHAKHIAHIDGVEVYSFKEGGHSVVRFLRDNGHLPAILAGDYRG